MPEPVGAEISACSPVAIAGHACAWAAVGSANARVNQSRTWGVKAESGTYDGTLARSYRYRPRYAQRVVAVARGQASAPTHGAGDRGTAHGRAARGVRNATPPAGPLDEQPASAEPTEMPPTNAVTGHV